MSRFISAAWSCVALLCALPTFVQAEVPCKVDCNLQFNVKFGPGANCAGPYKAPWYLYFPVDPCMVGPCQGSRFPNWPVCFPPPDAGATSGLPPALPPPTGPTSHMRYPDWPSQPSATPVMASNYGPRPNIVLTGGSTFCPVWQPTYYSPYPVFPQPGAFYPQYAPYWYGR